MREKALLVPMLNLAAHKADHLLVHQSLEAEKKAEKDKNGIGKLIVEDKSNPLARYMIKPDVAEVDLHVESLLDTRLEFKGAKEEDYLSKQISVFETCLNQAISRKLSKIIFIHGVGNGILKHEIEKRLKDYIPCSRGLSRCLVGKIKSYLFKVLRRRQIPERPFSDKVSVMEISGPTV